ncbi:LysR substrate-binding domain-containing protein [Roseomonas sp. WA12]
MPRQGKGPWTTASFRSRLRLDSGEALSDAAVRGLGVALLPAFLAAEDIEAGRLVQILSSFETEEAEITVVYPSRRLLEPRLRQFIDLIVATVSS